MTMKVTSGNSVYFKSSHNQAVKPVLTKEYSDKKITGLGYVTPDYAIKIPQKYTKLGEYPLPNNLKLYSYKLSNGYRVSIIPMEDSPAIVKTYVNVGSMNETPDIKGISHFLEHMAFNGTNGENGHIKLETGDSFKKIEAIGGWSNASTNYALTDYVNLAPQLDEKDLETQIKVLAAMSEDLKLSDEMIKKEKGPVSSEINMIMDDPQTIALDQTIRTLFNIKNPADELVGGSVKHIQNLTRKDVMDYYNKYYFPENTNIVVTGDVNPQEAIELITKNFTSQKLGNKKRYDEKLTPLTKTKRKDFVTDKAKSAEIVLGFVGPQNNNFKERILYNIAKNYLYSESVGLTKKWQDMNIFGAISGERITTRSDGNRFSYVGMTTSENNVEKTLHAVFNIISNIKPISNNELERIKAALKEGRENSFEYSMNVNNKIGEQVLEGTLDSYLNYDKIIDEITPKEVDDAIKKYFNLNQTAITVIHPSNNNVAFKGKIRKPFNEEKVETITLNNNFDVGFYNINSSSKIIDISLTTDIPYNKKPAVREILQEILYMGGTSNLSEDEYNKLKEELNLSIAASAGKSGLNITIDGNKNNYKKGLQLAKDLIYNPRITEENLQKAKKHIKEILLRSEITAKNLYYNEFLSKYDDYNFSDDEILNAIDDVNLDDVKEFHNYLLNNSRGTVTASSSEYDDIKKTVVDTVKYFKPVLPNNIKRKNLYKDVPSTIVLTKANNNSQASIRQVFNFKTENSIKNIIIAHLMNSILSSSSIGLFDVLREKEHLAYSVYSDTSINNDWGMTCLNILTTTDNKEISEQNFENVQRSINGFNRQINELKNGNFTENDLENAKRSVKADLLNNEGTYAKIDSLADGMNSRFGVGYQNEMYSQIDSITKEDIIEFAQNVFSNHPVYAITATQDTLDFNKEYLENLK